MATRGHVVRIDRDAKYGLRAARVGEASYPGQIAPNRFLPLGDPAEDIDPTILDSLEVDIAGDVRVRDQRVGRLTLTSSQGPVLPRKIDLATRRSRQRVGERH